MPGNDPEILVSHSDIVKTIQLSVSLLPQPISLTVSVFVAASLSACLSLSNTDIHMHLFSEMMCCSVCRRDSNIAGPAEHSGVSQGHGHYSSCQPDARERTG